MTTALATRQNVLKMDVDGNWYSVPAKEEFAFTQAVEAVMLAEFMSAEWHQANDDFQAQFGSYAKDK